MKQITKRTQLRLLLEKKQRSKNYNYMKYQEIKSLVLSKGYVFFDKGEYNLNIVFIRNSADFTNMFTDTCYVAYRDSNLQEQVLEIPCTTKAGLYYVDNPITYEGITGTAVIIPGQYKGVYELVDDYVTWLNYPFFKQVKPMNYWRDYDKDTILDEIQEQKKKIFGTHFHRMSNTGKIGGVVHNWSAGCIGSEEPYFKKVVELARKAKEIWGNSFTITILEK